MLRVHLFGTGRACYGDRCLAGFPAQQPCLFLCYLLLNRGKFHHREHLAAVFWGEYASAASRKYLRNTLWRLRSALQDVGARPEGYVQAESGSIAFVATDPFWLDIEVFEDAIAGCRDLAGSRLSKPQAVRLEEAVGLYSGDFLEGVYEDWCLYDRERLHLLYLLALGKLMAYHEAHGTYERGLAYGEAILSCDNAREKVHRQMMRLHWLLGDRNAALAQYHRCVQILRETMGVSPTAETRRIYYQIKSGQAGSAEAGATDVPEDRAVGGELPTRELAEQALTGLHGLQAAVDQMRAELNAIEGQLSTALRHLV